MTIIVSVFTNAMNMRLVTAIKVNVVTSE